MVFFAVFLKNRWKICKIMNISHPSEGKILLYLCNESGMTKQMIAQKLEIHPNHLSKIFKSKKVSQKIKERSARLFNVDIAVFSGKDLEGYPYYVMEQDIEYLHGITLEEVMRYLKEMDKRQSAERNRLLSIIENLTKK